jgi:hypothetical protein
MNKRFAQVLLLALSLLLLPRMAAAQTISRGAEPIKQSHHDLPGRLDLDNQFAWRLEEFRQMHQLQDQVQELLKDRKVLDRMQKLSEAELRQLKEKVFKNQNGNGLGLQSVPGQHIDPEAIRRFAEWLERGGHNLSNPEQAQIMMPDQAKPVPQLPSSAAPADSSTPPSPLAMPAPPSVFDRMEAKTTKWVMENLDEFGDDALEALKQVGKNEQSGPLAELLRSVRQHDFSDLKPNDPAMELSRRLPKLGNFLQQHGGFLGEARSLFQSVRMPRIGSPSVSVPSAVAADGDTWTTALLSILMLGAIVLFLCKGGLGSAARTDASEPWRLGPWPVPPVSVSTRRDVIHAFEHLALLCLGPAASACHHRELAERLAQQDSGNPARRQAAESLAELYEQARYAPADESLSPGQLTDARHALCFLAGVTAV